MKQALYFLIALGCLFLAPATASAQCTPLDNAVPGLTLNASAGGTNNRSGMVYNPGKDLYYSVNAGSSSYPCDVYDASGTLLVSPTQGFDYRGAWWNPAAGQFEGNGFSSLGIFVQTLEAGTGYPTGSGASIFTADQPDDQSVGDLDTDANEIIYYDDGFIHRYDRTDNSFLGQYLISDLPVDLADINSNSVVYTGCLTREIGIYDHTNQRLLFINKSTGAYNGYSQLPRPAPQRSSFGVSYANGLLWLFDGGTWFSYTVVDIWPTSLEAAWAQGLTLFPNPARDRVTIELADQPRKMTLRLQDLQGRELIRTETGLVQTFDLALPGLPSGLYVLQIRSGEEISTRRLLIE